MSTENRQVVITLKEALAPKTTKEIYCDDVYMDGGGGGVNIGCVKYEIDQKKYYLPLSNFVGSMPNPEFKPQQ